MIGMKRTSATKLHQFWYSLGSRGPLYWKTRRMIAKFASKTGLVYFGAVHQHDDEHSVIRGFTASLTHTDNHYCVGSFEGYDVLLVNRTDFLQNHDKSISSHNWMILAISLQNVRDIPHLLLRSTGPKESAYRAFFTIFPLLKEVSFGVLNKYGQEFLNRFKLYTKPSHAIEVEEIIDKDIYQALGAHFWPRSAEISGNMLYIYDNNPNITRHSLDALMQQGVWLAQQLDKQPEED